MQFVSLDKNFIHESDLLAVERLAGISKFTHYPQPPSDQAELIERMKDAELVTGRIYIDFNSEVLKASKRLKAIFNNSVGYNNIDLETANKLGIKVFNAPGYNANAVAEFAFSLIVSLLRKIPAAQEHVRANGVEYRIFEGLELHNRTLGIIGAGNIGRKIIDIGKGFGMNVMVNTKTPSSERALALGVEKFHELDQVVKNSDILVIAIPLNQETKYLINREKLKLMKKSAYLVNIARQKIVDEQALAELVISGKLAGAALDMLIDDPFYLDRYSPLIQEFVNLPNVIITPHIGGETVEANKALGKIFLQNVSEFLAGGSKNCVNP